MRLTTKALVTVLSGGVTATPAELYQEAVTALTPLAWWKLDETSGTNAVNSGSGGATYDGTISGGVTLGVTDGSAATGTAMTFDAATGRIEIVNTDATLRNLANFTWMALINIAGAGEGSAGCVITFASSASEHFLLIRDANGRKAVFVVRYDGGTLSRKQTNVDQLPVNGTLFWVVARHNGTSKVSRLQWALPGAVALTTPTFLTDTTGVGNRVNAATDMQLGAFANGNSTFNGNLKEIAVFSSELSDANVLTMITASGG